MSLTNGRGTAASASAGAQMIDASGATSSGRRKGNQCDVQCFGRSLDQRFAPDCEATIFENKLADFGCSLQAARQDVDKGLKLWRMIAAVGEATLGEGREDLSPARGIE